MALKAIPLWSSLLDIVLRGSRPQPRVIAGLVIGLLGLGLVPAPVSLLGTAIVLTGIVLILKPPALVPAARLTAARRRNSPAPASLR